MLFDMETLEASSRYKILTATVTPRPIAWVTTLSEDGVVNAAPYSFFNVLGHEPPTLAIGLLAGLGRFKDTATNILATGEFVVNLVSEANAAAMNITCVDAPPDVDELALAGLTAVASHKIRPPRIAESPVSFECRTHASLVTGPRQTAVIGRIVCAHVDDSAVQDKERCHIDTPALQLIGRMHGSGWYARCTDLFQLDRPRWPTCNEMERCNRIRRHEGRGAPSLFWFRGGLPCDNRCRGNQHYNSCHPRDQRTMVQVAGGKLLGMSRRF